MPYEWIALKGQGDMSSSKGNLVSIVNLTQTIPPEVVRYMIFRVKPMRSITFDPGLPLLNLVDEYDDVSAHNRDQRAAELARLEGMPPLGVPFKHLVHLVQITEGDIDKLCAILRRHNIPVPAQEALQSRVAYAQYWLQHFSPAEIRLRLHKELPAQVAHLTPASARRWGYWDSVCDLRWMGIRFTPWCMLWRKKSDSPPKRSLRRSILRCSISRVAHGLAGFELAGVRFRADPFA